MIALYDTEEMDYHLLLEEGDLVTLANGDYVFGDLFIDEIAVTAKMAFACTTVIQGMAYNCHKIGKSYDYREILIVHGRKEDPYRFYFSNQEYYSVITNKESYNNGPLEFRIGLSCKAFFHYEKSSSSESEFISRKLKGLKLIKDKERLAV